jgi:hypothetical protein
MWHDQQTALWVAKMSGNFSAATAPQLRVLESGASKAGM